ncbi:MAG: hypothetical protein KAJ16_09075, partial [Calditrichia bacterium]|nr:hypothetical protein [Calditrichia bacterium]
MFNTIDILKFSTGDTLHLPVAPMINLNVPPMLNNEQVEIPGIPFPDYFNDQIVSYGIINNTNIGYIYLYRESPTATADQQFAQAVNALGNTEGLIIDMRLNYGGWALFDEAFDVLFNDFSFTIEDAYRSNYTSLSLSPSGNATLFRIDPYPTSLYDHPIAILLGPTCISMGDITAHRFQYHPTVRFFGKSPGASMGDNLVIENIPDWYLRYSISDMFHINRPGHYLNRMEFPIDYPVWHNPADVANNVDAVVEKALSWMTDLVYGHDVTLNDIYFMPAMDTINVQAIIENPNDYPVSSKVIINTVDSSYIDSVNMYRPLPGDTAEIWLAEFPAPAIEGYFWISISAYDSVNNKNFTTRNVNRFVTFGPIVKHGMQLVDSYKTGPFYFFEYELILRNDGQTTTVPNVRSDLSISNSNYTITNNSQVFGDIAAGQTLVNPQNYLFRTRQDSILIDTLDVQFSFFSDDILYWQTNQNMVVNLKRNMNNIPVAYNLSQNYPNPFNPTTTIEF